MLVRLHEKLSALLSALGLIELQLPRQLKVGIGYHRAAARHTWEYLLKYYLQFIVGDKNEVVLPRSRWS